MKKSLLLLSFSLLSFTGFAQDDKKADDKDANDAVIEHNTYNKWTIEAVAGQSKGTKPYSDGYYTSNPNKVLGDFNFNTFGLGVRYMFSPKFGLKLDGNFETFENNEDTDSKPFKTEQ